MRFLRTMPTHLLFAVVLLTSLPVRPARAQFDAMEATVDRLIRLYFQAVEDESLPMIEQYYHFGDHEARQETLAQFQFAFNMVDTRIESISVSDIKLYYQRGIGLAFAEVRGTLTQPMLGESLTKEHAYAIFVRSDGSQWKIAKVMRRSDYDNAIRIAAAGDGGGIGGPPDGGDEPDGDGPPQGGTGGGDVVGPYSLGLNAVADNYVYAYSYLNWYNTNWGGHVLASAGWHPVGGESRAYFRFDLPEIARVEKATLRLYQCHAAGPGDLDLGVYVVTSPWQEGRGVHPPDPALGTQPGDLTWNRQPTFAPTPIATFRPSKEPGVWVQIDVTDQVNAWLRGTANHGLLLKPCGQLSRMVPECVRGFRTREYEDESQRPMLVLEVAGQGNGTDAGDDPDDGGFDAEDGQGGSAFDDEDEEDDSEDVGTKQQAYQEHIEAYNRLTSLMAAGKGDTPEAQEAYRAYKEAKARYEAVLSSRP